MSFVFVSALDSELGSNERESEDARPEQRQCCVGIGHGRTSCSTYSGLAKVGEAVGISDANALEYLAAGSDNGQKITTVSEGRGELKIPIVGNSRDNSVAVASTDGAADEHIEDSVVKRPSVRQTETHIRQCDLATVISGFNASLTTGRLAQHLSGSEINDKSGLIGDAGHKHPGSTVVEQNVLFTRLRVVAELKCNCPRDGGEEKCDRECKETFRYFHRARLLKLDRFMDLKPAAKAENALQDYQAEDYGRRDNGARR